MKGKKYELQFQPVRRQRLEMMGRFLLGFVAIALLLVLVSAVALKRDGLIDRIFGAYIDQTEPATEADDAWHYSGSALFLLCVTDDAAQSLRAVSLARVELAPRAVHIYPLSPNTAAPEDSGEITLEQALKSGGVKRLKSAVEALTETKVDRYLCATDAAFMKMVTTLGSVTVEVPERIRYNRDFSLTLAQGRQSLMGDMLLRYLRYLGAQKQNAQLRQGELLALILRTYLTPANAQTPELLERRFHFLVNLMTTDISVMDFYGQKEMLQSLLQAPDQIQIDVQEGETP